MKPRKKHVTASYTVGLDLGDRRHTAEETIADTRAATPAGLCEK